MLDKRNDMPPSGENNDDFNGDISTIDLEGNLPF